MPEGNALNHSERGHSVVGVNVLSTMKGGYQEAGVKFCSVSYLGGGSVRGFGAPPWKTLTLKTHIPLTRISKGVNSQEY